MRTKKNRHDEEGMSVTSTTIWHDVCTHNGVQRVFSLLQAILYTSHQLDIHIFFTHPELKPCFVSMQSRLNLAHVS